MENTLFNQLKVILAHIQHDYALILQDNNELRNAIIKLQEENAELKRNIEKFTSEISGDES